MKIIFDLPDGLTEADIGSLKNHIMAYARSRLARKNGIIDVKSARIAAINSKWGSLKAFCEAQGYPVSTAWVAMQGKLRGPKARLIVEDVKREFNV